MYVVTVDFFIHEAHLDSFRSAMLENAKLSVEREAGCQQFDVTIAENDPAHIFLYEVYDDAAAFQAHLASDHFKSFNVLASTWVREKSIRIFTLLR